MKRRQHGFTMVEVMIFLAISGAMLGWSVLSIRGRQQQVQFSQAVREFENLIKDYINDVGTGYYPNAANMSCNVNNPFNATSDLSFAPSGTAAAGTNKDCIFIGKAIQFGVHGSNGEDYNVYTVLGRRQTPSGSSLREVASFREARPQPLLKTTGADTFDYTEHKSLGWGAHITSVSSGLVGFFTTFAQSGSRGLESGSADTQSIAIPDASGAVFPFDATQNTAVNAIQNYLVDAPAQFTPQTICLSRADNEETALITIGFNGRSIDVDSEFKAC